MIKVEKISKLLKDIQILQDISFDIKRGDFIAVMGPSGSGKSTLLYSVSGMDSISDGKVLFDGVSLSEMREEALAEFRLTKMGFVFQNAQMLKNLSVFDNIILPGLAAKKESADAIRRRAAELMKRMDIEGIEARDIREVSGGQLQRASICRAMINQPEILFLDEPTGALNSGATDQVLAILEDLNREGMTILTVTPSRVAAMAKKGIYRDGRIAAPRNFLPVKTGHAELDVAEKVDQSPRLSISTIDFSNRSNRRSISSSVITGADRRIDSPSSHLKTCIGGKRSDVFKDRLPIFVVSFSPEGKAYLSYLRNQSPKADRCPAHSQSFRIWFLMISYFLLFNAPFACCFFRLLS